MRGTAASGVADPVKRWWGRKPPNKASTGLCRKGCQTLPQQSRGWALKAFTWKRHDQRHLWWVVLAPAGRENQRCGSRRCLREEFVTVIDGVGYPLLGCSDNSALCTKSKRPRNTQNSPHKPCVATIHNTDQKLGLYLLFVPIQAVSQRFHTSCMGDLEAQCQFRELSEKKVEMAFLSMTRLLAPSMVPAYGRHRANIEDLAYISIWKTSVLLSLSPNTLGRSSTFLLMSAFAMTSCVMQTKFLNLEIWLFCKCI